MILKKLFSMINKIPFLQKLLERWMPFFVAEVESSGPQWTGWPDNRKWRKRDPENQMSFIKVSRETEDLVQLHSSIFQVHFIRNFFFFTSWTHRLVESFKGRRRVGVKTINIHLVSGAGVRTHNLLIVRRLP